MDVYNPAKQNHFKAKIKQLFCYLTKCSHNHRDKATMNRLVYLQCSELIFRMHPANRGRSTS